MSRVRVLLPSLLVVAVLAPAPARAQEARASLELVAQPIWHERDDRLGLRVLITNEGDIPLSGPIVTVAAHSRVTSRSELHESFTSPGFEASRITAADLPEVEIGPDDTYTVRIEEPLASLQSLATTSLSGVYPLTVSLFDRDGVGLDSLTTPMIYYPAAPQAPLNLVVVVPLAAVPGRGPAGVFEDDGSLGAALAEEGWLTGLIAAIDESAGPQPRPAAPPPEGRTRKRPRRPPRPPAPRPVHLGFAPTPRLIEELSDIADGFERSGPEGTQQVAPNTDVPTAATALLERVAGVAEHDNVQPVLVPYSFPDLPTVVEHLRGEDVAAQLGEAEKVLEQGAGVEVGRDWVLPPGGRVDLPTLESLRLNQSADGIFVTDESMEPTDGAGLGCPEVPLSFTCPIEIRTTAAEPTSGYLTDQALQERLGELAADQRPRLAAQRFFAETAIVREELPSREGRVLQTTLPALWQPPRWLSRLLFNGLRDAPWLQTLTPEEGIELSQDLVPTRVRRLRPKLPSPATAPDATYMESVRNAQAAVENFRSVQPPAALVQRLTRNTLVSESRLWWHDTLLLERGERYATEASGEIAGELGKLSLGGSREVNLTSQDARVQVVVFNDASYEVGVVVHLVSPELRLDRTIRETVQARGLRQLPVDVTADTSGIFDMAVILETPAGTEIETRTIRVRSTNFNKIALGLTFGALAFLVLFYLTRGLRRGRREARSAGA